MKRKYLGWGCQAFASLAALLLSAGSALAAKPAVIWSNPASIIYGTQLSQTQFNPAFTDSGLNVAGAAIFYADGKQLATATYQSNGSVTGFTKTGTDRDFTLNAGNHTLTVDFQAAGYDEVKANDVTVSITVQPKDLNVSILALTGTYGSLAAADFTGADGAFDHFLDKDLNGTVDAGDYSQNPTVSGKIALDTDLTFGLTTAVKQDSGANTYAITLVPNDSNNRLANYTLRLTSQFFTVNKRVVKVTPDNKDKVYGDANPGFTAVYEIASGNADPTRGLTDGDRAKDSNNALINQPKSGVLTSALAMDAPSSTSTTPANTDKSIIITSLPSANNYTFVSDNGNNKDGDSAKHIHVKPRDLTVTPDDKQRAYYTDNPTFTGIISGAVNGDGAGFVATYGVVGVDKNSDAGTYPIGVTGIADNNSTKKLSNYTVIQKQGTLTITKVSLTITANNKDISVGDALPGLDGKLSGLVSKDDGAKDDIYSAAVFTTAPQLKTNPTYDSASAKQGDTYSIVLNNTPTAKNYSPIAFVAGTVTVKAKDASTTVTWNPTGDITYGTALKASAVQTASSSIDGTFSNYKLDGNAFTDGIVPNAGSHELTVDFAPKDTGTYGNTTIKKTFTVNKKSLWIVLLNQTATYGVGPTNLNIQGKGWLIPADSNADDGIADGHGLISQDSNLQFSPQLVLASSANSTSPVSGTFQVAYTSGDTTVKTNSYTGYKIFVGQAAGASNYDIKYVKLDAETKGNPVAMGTVGGDPMQNFAILTIQKATLTVTANPLTVNYGAAIPTPTPKYSGLIPFDQDAQGNPKDGVLLANPILVPNASQGSPVGQYTIGVSGAFASNYTVNSTPGTLTIVPSWGTLNPITYGTALGANQLNAQGSSDVTITYNPPAGTVLHAGTQTLTATVTRSSDNFQATLSNSVVVNKKPLGVMANSVTRVYGQDNPPLTFAYDLTAFVGTDTPADIDVPPSIGTSATAASNVGTYEIGLTGGSDNDYSLLLTPGSLTVTKAILPIVWPAPAAITYGTALSIGAQLNATVSGVDGTLVYNPAGGTKLNAGLGQILSVTFTPSAANAANYAVATKTVTIDVNKASPTISWPNPAAISYPAALGAGQLNASADVGGTFAYTPAAGTVLTAGPQTLSATFTPSSQNYTTATATVGLTVNKGTPTINWPTPADIATGTPLGSAQLNATIAGNVAGDLAYSPPAGTVLPTGAGQTLSVFFLPTDTANYKFAQASVYINVGVTGTKPTITGQPQNVSVAAGGSATFTVIATGSGLTYQWQFNGTAISGATSASYTVASAANSNAGSYSVVVSNSSGSVTSQQAVLTITAAAAGQYIDLNGDGSSDLLFESDQGYLATWSLDTAGKLKTAGFLTPNNVGDVKWRIVGEGDFNGDGKTDILFQHTDGTLAVWYMNGTSLSSASLLSPSNPGDKNWRVVGTGDFNGDKKTDIVFQHTDGTLAVWYMNGSTLSAPALLSPSNPGDAKWRVAGVGDVNKDGKPDLVFQHTDGTLAAWLMNGTSLSSAKLLTPNNPGSPAFRVVAVTDVNQDGNVDLVFQNTGTRRLAVWMMNGTTLTTSTATNPEDPGAGWQVVGPK